MAPHEKNTTFWGVEPETTIEPRHRLHTFFLRDMTSVRFIQGQVRQGGTALFSLDRWVQPTGGSLPFKKTTGGNKDGRMVS